MWRQILCFSEYEIKAFTIICILFRNSHELVVFCAVVVVVVVVVVVGKLIYQSSGVLRYVHIVSFGRYSRIYDLRK